MVMMGVRKALDHLFAPSELKILDDILPEFKRHQKLNDEEHCYDVRTLQKIHSPIHEEPIDFC